MEQTEAVIAIVGYTTWAKMCYQIWYQWRALLAMSSFADLHGFIVSEITKEYSDCLYVMHTPSIYCGYW